MRHTPVLLVLAATACSAATPAAPDAVAPDTSDGPIVAATKEELALPAAHALPLGPEHVLRLSDGDGIDITSTALPMKDGSVVVVFDRFDAAFTGGSLYAAQSSKGSRFTKPAPLARGNSAFVAGPSLLLHDGAAFLYHEESTRLQGRPSLWRSALVDGRWGAAERLPAIADLSSLLSWPELTETTGGVQLAFRGGPSSSCRVLVSGDGVTFRATTPPCGDAGIAMAASGAFADGTLAFAHQNGDPANMISYVMTSSDQGATWSRPIVVSEAANVHDTSFAPRLDGGIDLYFIYPPDAHGFSLFRRALTPAGVLGPEERVTQSSLGEPSKPHAARMADGRLLLSYAEIAERAPSGEPSVQRIVLAALATDAPAP